MSGSRTSSNPDAPRPPSIVAIQVPGNPVAGAAAPFTAALSDPDQVVAGVAWSFGDGESVVDTSFTRSGASVVSAVDHTFAATGIYNLVASVEVEGATIHHSAMAAVAVPGSACGTHNFTVTTPDFYYAFAGLSGENPAISVCGGETFTFHLDGVSQMHPFCIWKAGETTDAPGVTSNCQSGTTDVVWQVPASLPGGARYACEVHFFGNSFAVH